MSKGKSNLVRRLLEAIGGCLERHEENWSQYHWADAFSYRDRIVTIDSIRCGDYPFDSMLNEIKISIKSHRINEGGNEMGEIREEIKTELLQTIKTAATAQDVLDAIHNFNEFLAALSVEEGMQRKAGKA